jgi:creatinine amidohydrolase
MMEVEGGKVMPVRFDALTFEEIGRCAREGYIVLIPTGCTEQQGPHLPVGFDTWFAEALMIAAAERAGAVHDVRALVLPTLPFGPTPEHRGYGSGYVHLPKALHDAVVRAAMDSLVEQGFQRLVLWRGCGGHDLSEVVEGFNAQSSGTARAFLPGHPFYDIWCRIGDPIVEGGHADSFTTSIMLYRWPESVRQERIFDPQSSEPAWEDPNLDFSRYSSSGVIGDPTHASVELGERLWEASVEAVVAILEEIAGTEGVTR